MAYEKQTDRIEALEEQVATLSRELAESRDAHRSLHDQITNNLNSISKLNVDVADLKHEQKRVEDSLTVVTGQHKNHVTRYE